MDDSREAEKEAEKVYAGNASEADVGPVFEIADPGKVVSRVDPQAFFEPVYDQSLVRMIEHVVDVEGPVLSDVLARRIARAHGWQRTGAKIQQRIDALASRSFETTKESVGTFYWPKTISRGSPVAFRRARDESLRAIDEICMPEMTSLAWQVLQAGKSGEEAVQAIARTLGLQRLRSATRIRIEEALQQAKETQLRNV
jgi:hypothetical protein